MFIAMNTFTVNDSRHEEFEEIWKSRERHLKEMSGFLNFKLLKGDENQWVDILTLEIPGRGKASVRDDAK